MSTEQEVIDIVVEQLGVDRNEVKKESLLVEDLNADSLDLTELIMTLEERFNCDFPEEDATKIKTVSDIVTYLNDKR